MSKVVELEEISTAEKTSEALVEPKSPAKTPTALEIKESQSPLHAPVEMSEELTEGKSEKKPDEIILFY